MMTWKRKYWAYITAIIVVFIAFNPEMMQLALFVDAVGLELFLLLLEVQLLVVAGAFFNKYVRPTLTCLVNAGWNYFLGVPWATVKEKPEVLFLVVPSQAALMQLLVFSAAINIAVNTWQ